MNIEKLIDNISKETLKEYFRERTELSSFKPIEEDLDEVIINIDKFSNLQKLGEAELQNNFNEELLFFCCRYEGVLSERSAKKKQYEVAKKVLKEDFKDGALFVFYDEKGNFRFSFIRHQYDQKEQKYSNWKRYTYFVEPDKQNKTFKKRLTACSFRSLDDIQEAFSVEKLTKAFYEELSNWYFSSIDEVKFPNDKNEDEHKLKTNSMIRLITRLMFVWFMKQKKLIPESLFDEKELDKMLNYKDDNQTNYYRAILQNLFFATLNTPKEGTGRKFIKSYKGKSNQQGVQNYFRYEDLFEDTTKFLELVKDIPFLNGGLFENLDVRGDDEKKLIYLVDAFSDPKKNRKRLVVPDYLFFGTRNADISSFFEDDRKSDIQVDGIIDILNRYDFTIDENTADDFEVALDPELLGTVFENLLASYNPETQNTARKESGSFYTPRLVVDYMVKESIHYHLAEQLNVSKDKVDDLLKPKSLELSEKHRDLLVKALANVKILDPACGSGAFPMGCLQYIVKILNYIDPKNERWKSVQLEKLKDELKDTIDQSGYDKIKTNIENIFENQLNDPDYARKLYFIENCLFGVDIQPIAMQITKLRFFVSLLVEQEIDHSKENAGIIALPNLETKFIAANTLLQLSSQRKAQREEVYKLEAELEMVREKHFNARTPKTKKKYRSKDKSIRAKIAEHLKNDGFGAEDADKIANWDPYNPNAKSDWFDAKWMFGVFQFDIVIGNPPYIQLQKALDEDRKYADLYDQEKYTTFERTGDIYCLFYEKGLNSLHRKGMLCYITSNKWMRAKYGSKLRAFFSKRKALQLIDLGPDIFEAATVDTNILIVQNDSKKINKPVLDAVKLEDKTQLEHPELLNFLKFKKLDQTSWIVLKPDEQALKDKIEKLGTPLKDWNVRINRGILTGYNKAFIIDGETKDRLIKEDPNSEELLKPILRGKDIKRYKANFADLWLIASHNGYKRRDGTIVPRVNIGDYPAIKNWLDQHWNKISKRQDKGATPYHLRNCAYMEDFEKEKIVYKEIVRESSFFIDHLNYYPEATTFYLVGKEVKYLLGALNSKPCTYFFKKYYAGGGLGEDGFRYKKDFLEKIPIPKVENAIKNQLHFVVDEIIDNKGKGLSSKKLENKINIIFYKIYKLNYEEVKIIDPEFSMSREEYINYRIDESFKQ